MKVKTLAASLVLCTTPALASPPTFDSATGYLRFDAGHAWLVQTAWSSASPKVVDVCSSVSGGVTCDLPVGEFKYNDWTDKSSGRVSKTAGGQVLIDGVVVSQPLVTGPYMTREQVQAMIDAYDFDMKAAVDAHLLTIGFQCDIE